MLKHFRQTIPIDASKWVSLFGAIVFSTVALCQSSVSSPSTGFAHEMLVAHNTIRARFGTGALMWSDELAYYAQQWANELIANGGFAPRRDHRYGENLFEISGAWATPRQVVEAWASEARNYDYKSNGCTSTCGHFKQLVWRDTKLVGCGVARDRRREVWVCNYDPLGNITGERPY